MRSLPLSLIVLFVITACNGGNVDNPESNGNLDQKNTNSLTTTIYGAVTAPASFFEATPSNNDERPVAGAHCTLEGTEHVQVTNESGEFSFTNVTRGYYCLLCKAESTIGNKFCSLKNINTSNSDTLSDDKFNVGGVVITLAGSIIGNVIIDDSQKLPPVLIYIPGSSSFITKANSNGSFKIDEVPAGVYSLRIEYEGYHAVELTDISVTAGETTSLETITLQPIEESSDPAANIVLGNGLSLVSTRTVNVALSLSDESANAQLRLSENSVFADSGWQTYKEQLQYSFNSDGNKVLYAWFKMGGSVIGPVSDSIAIDTLPPTDTSIAFAEGSVTTVREVTLKLHATDATTSVTSIKIGTQDWQDYSESLAYTLPEELGEHAVFVQYRDAAGNISNAVSATITLIEPGSGKEVSGNITENTIWNADDGLPYLITGSIYIYPTATLTITEGVVVNSSNQMPIYVNGQLKIRGTAAQPVHLNGIALYPHIEKTNEGVIDIENAIIENSNIGGMPKCVGSFRLISSTIQNSSVYVLCPAGNSEVVKNRFDNVGLKIFADVSKYNPTIVYNNLFIGNSQSGFAVSTLFQSEVDALLTGPILTGYPTSTILHYNSFINTSTEPWVAVWNNQNMMLVASNNYWGTTNEQEISAMINGEFYQQVIFNEWLNDPHSETPKYTP
ncbi:MAG: carboxypeptidase regulatory-like domain-containing protein [Deltaproteobacteria bacterium]|nr:carboxypeptidase regulatory-like domain-containing protein [Deltaproteobacteria bacterium]